MQNMSQFNCKNYPVERICIISYTLLSIILNMISSNDIYFDQSIITLYFIIYSCALLFSINLWVHCKLLDDYRLKTCETIFFIVLWLTSTTLLYVGPMTIRENQVLVTFIFSLICPISYCIYASYKLITIRRYETMQILQFGSNV